MINEFKMITIEEFENNIYGNLMEFNDMTLQEKEEYLEIYSIYSYLASQYIVKVLDLHKYDEIFTNSKLHYQMVSEDSKDLYQAYFGAGLSYFYIRNNFYVDRLTSEEKEYLKDKLLHNNYVLDDDSISFLSKTLLKVIDETIEGEGRHMISFGPNSDSFYKPSNSIVIGVRYDDYFVVNGQSDEEWSNEDDQRQEQCFSLMEKMENIYQKKFSFPVSIIKYNDFSVNKKLSKTL